MAYNPNNPNGSATSANSSPVVIASDQAAVPISDNGSSLTVDGSVTVSGTVTANAGTGTQNVSVQNASIPVTDNGGSLTVDGSVSVSNFPATQPVSGTVEIGSTSLAALETISVANFPATQPVSGTVTIQDGGNTITVDGTVTANAGTGTFATSDANAVSQATATAAQKGYLSLAGATATLPTYTAGNTNAMTMTTSGLLRVDGSNVTQPVSGTVTADTELPTAVSLGDSTANPTAPHVGSCIEGFNGTTWDRLKTDGALAGTAANDSVVGILAAGIGPGFAIRINPSNLGTAANSVSNINVDGGTTISVGIGTTTTGTFIFEGTADGTNFFSVEVFDATQDLWVSGQNLTPTLGRTYHIATGGLRQIRLRTVTTLGATVAHAVNISLSQQLIAGIDTGAAPHNFGYTLVHKDGEYSTAQTGAALWTPASGKKFVVTDITITTGGTTAGIVTLWQGASGDTAYTVGTDPSVFRGEFAPSANSKPGVVKSFNVPYISTTADHVLRVTTSAAMTVYVQVNGYEI